jgi:acyl-CoA thioester hydrolase
LAQYPVVVEFPVAWGEMDAFSHVNNAMYFRYFENARIAYFDAIKYMEEMGKDGVGPILASTDCRFIAPLTYPDTIRIGARVTEFGDDSFVMQYCVVSEKLGRVAAKGQGLLVSYDYENGKKAPVSQTIKDRIEALESSVSGT